MFHIGTIVVNSTARFGDNCVIQACVVVSENVVGGDYVYLAPGVKVNSNVHISNNVVCGMNAVITKDIAEEGTTWGGVPARKISDNGFYSEDKFKGLR